MSKEDIGSLKRDLTSLRAQIGILESRARQTWVYPQTPPPFSLQHYLVIGSGNTLATVGSTTIYGLQYTSGSYISTCPAADPGSISPGAAPSFISPAQLVANDGSYTWVWVASAISPTIYPLQYDMVGSIPSGTPAISFHSFQVPETGSPSILHTVYIPSRL